MVNYLLSPYRRFPRFGSFITWSHRIQTRQTIRTEGFSSTATCPFLPPRRSRLSQLTMSDSDGDIDDELLALAGATEKKRKRQAGGSKQSGNKKRKARYVLSLVSFVPTSIHQSTSSSDSDSENIPESEEGQEANPFPLDGKYEDDADRER